MANKSKSKTSTLSGPAWKPEKKPSIGRHKKRLNKKQKRSYGKKICLG